jgi:hypothetical protein
MIPPPHLEEMRRECFPFLNMRGPDWERFVKATPSTFRCGTNQLEIKVRRLNGAEEWVPLNMKMGAPRLVDAYHPHSPDIGKKTVEEQWT